MEPFIDCKYKSIYNILSIYDKDTILLNKLYSYILVSADKILETKVKGKFDFQEFLKLYGIEQITESKVKNLKIFLKENLKNNSVIILKTDLFYQEFSNKYFNQKHKKHNTLVTSIEGSKVKIIEHEYADSSIYKEMIIDVHELSKWYYGYIENYYNTKLDIADTVYKYRLNNNLRSKIDFNKLYSYSFDIDCLKNNIKVLYEYLDTKMALKDRIKTMANLINYKLVEKKRYSLFKEEKIVLILTEEINILNSIRKKLYTINEEYNNFNNEMLKYIYKEENLLNIFEEIELNRTCVKLCIRNKNKISLEEEKIGEILTYIKIKEIDKNYILADLLCNENKILQNDFLNMQDMTLNELIENLNIHVNYQKGFLLGKEKIYEKLLLLNYTIENVNIQNNSINGYILKNNTKYFFKILNLFETKTEFIGHFKIYKKLPCSDLLEVIMFEDASILVFSYDLNVKKNEGLLNDFLVARNEQKKLTLEENELLEKIIMAYTSCMNDIDILINYPMQKFFKDRIESRLINWYKDMDLFNFDIKLNNNECDKKVREIILETIEYFNICEGEKVCYLTQGDPNLLNIGVTPVFFDYATSGYNPIVADTSTFLYSTLFADAYFAPKYHKSSYYNHERIYETLKNYEINLIYSKDEINKVLDINFNPKSSIVRVVVIRKYLNKLKQLDIPISSDIKYYFVMRVLCVLNLCEMEEKDIIYSIALLYIFYNAFDKEKEDVKDDLLKILNRLEG